MQEFDDKLGVYSEEFNQPIDASMSQDERFSFLLNQALLISGKHDSFLKENQIEALINENQVWVITQYKILTNDLGHIDKNYSISTRICQINKFFVVRYFAIESADKIIMEIYAQFAAIDFYQRKVVRLSTVDIAEHNIVDNSKKIRFDKFSVTSDLNEIYSNEIRIQSKDIDSNMHVNNGVYLKWSFNTLKLIGLTHKSVDEIDVRYGKEILPEHQVQITVYEKNDLQTYFRIMNSSTNEEACIVRIKWNE